ETLRVLIVTAFASLSRDEVIARLETAGIANASVNTMHDVWGHPQLAARERWRTIDSSAGPLLALIPPATNSSFTARMDKIPALGEHTASLLAELGYTEQQIQAFIKEGVI